MAVSENKEGVRRTRIFIAQDSETFQHVLVRALETPVTELRYESVPPALLSDFLRATTLDELLDVIDSDLSPLFHEKEREGVWGGRVYESVREFVDQRLPKLFWPDSNVLNDQTVIYPRVQFEPLDPLVFRSNNSAASISRAIERRSLERAWFLSDEAAGNPPVACVVVEPLSEWLAAKNLLAICGSLHVYLRDGLPYSGKSAPVWPGFEATAFEAREGDCEFPLRAYVAPLCIIAPPFKPAEIPSENRKRVRLSDASPYLSWAFDILKPTGQRHNAWHSRMEVNKKMGVVVVSKLKRGPERDSPLSEYYHVSLVVENDMISSNRMSFAEVIKSIGLSLVTGPSGEWGWEWSFSPAESEGRGDAILKPANLMGALWSTMFHHPGYELTACAHCKKIVLSSSRGTKSKYCSTSCRVLASKERARTSREIRERRNRNAIESFKQGEYEWYDEHKDVKVVSMVDKVLSERHDGHGALTEE